MNIVVGRTYRLKDGRVKRLLYVTDCDSQDDTCRDMGCPGHLAFDDGLDACYMSGGPPYNWKIGEAEDRLRKHIAKVKNATEA